MEKFKRIRLVFRDDDILSKAQKLDGLNRCWVLLNSQEHDTVSNVASHLLDLFQLEESCPNGLILSISGFVLPSFESSFILKDDEVIRVKRKEKDVLPIEENDAANEVGKLKAKEKKPVANGVLLLANEEFEKEKGGYESDEESEDEDEDVPSSGAKISSGANEDLTNGKRKAADKIPGPKKKKLRFEASTSVAKDVLPEKLGNCHQDGAVKGKTKLAFREKNDNIAAEENVENNAQKAESSEQHHMSESGMERNSEIEEDGKDTPETKLSPKIIKKVPSRSARRKYAKRRWLKELKKIQKQNSTCESEGLRNWKEDQAKAERKKKWKTIRANHDKIDLDDQPKGLLHWKPSSQDPQSFKGKKRERTKHEYFHKHRNPNGDVDKWGNEQSMENAQPTQNGNIVEGPTPEKGDGINQPSSCAVEDHGNQICDTSEKLDEDSTEENEVVPILIRPGHIRFEPIGKEGSLRESQEPVETFQWNGITSKKKGQKWGKENRSFIPRSDHKTSHEATPEMHQENEELPDKVNFDKLPSLSDMPKEGDIIAYRVLELSSTWTPELSAYRVGKVSWYNTESRQIMLVPVPDYPIFPEKIDVDEAAQPDNSLYKDDGSLEIDFPSLIDVRIVKNGSSRPDHKDLHNGSAANEAPSAVLPSTTAKQIADPSSGLFSLNPTGSEVRTSLSYEDPEKVQFSGTPKSHQDEDTPLAPTAETNGANVWDQLTEALSAKKEALLEESGWSKAPKKLQLRQPNGPGKNGQKAKPSQAGKGSWSYKALRGSALGPTMAILRSRKDI